MTDFYDRGGRRITVRQWARAVADRQVARTTVNGLEVSTVWLGLEPPKVFETMVFELGSRDDLYVERYCTEGEAREGHQRVVSTLRAVGLGGLRKLS